MVQPARGNTGVGGTLTVPGRVTHGHGAISHYYSGISLALERLAPIMTYADTSRNLRWQQTMAGYATKLTMWKMEAKSSPGLQFYAYMQPGKFFMVVRHSMETIYSTTTDIAMLHGKVVLFTGDRKGTRKCGLIVLPPQSTLSGRNARSLMKKKN